MVANNRHFTEIEYEDGEVTFYEPSDELMKIRESIDWIVREHPDSVEHVGAVLFEMYHELSQAVDEIPKVPEATLDLLRCAVEILWSYFYDQVANFVTRIDVPTAEVDWSTPPPSIERDSE